MFEFLKRFAAPAIRPPPPAGPPPEVPGMRRPRVLWADAYDVPVARLPCPNCGSMALKPLSLTVRYARPDMPMRFARVVRCPDCACLFYEQQKPPDYAEEQQLQAGRVPFYLQQGAGIAAIGAPLARAGKPPGSRYLDVGCGFGFALDFAARALQWQAQGIDPSPIAALGGELLGTAIECRYLGDDEPALAGAFDVVMASETIEHVRSPAGFLRTLRKLLRPGGVLILTTPDSADIRPQTAPGAVTGLLSPGFHLILQTRASLEALLRGAGFKYVAIEKDGYSLVAYAGERPLRLQAGGEFHAGLLDYLARRAADFPPGSDLHLGFAGRALQEAVNAGAMQAAADHYDALRQACQARFGIDLDTIEQLPAEAATCGLQRLGEIMPLSLGGLLYADTMRRFAEGAPRPAFERRLSCAADATDALRRAAAELTMEDALSEEIGWTARAEALLCAAVAGDPGLIARLRQMPAFPGNDAKRPHLIRERALVALVNAGHHELAIDFAGQTGLQCAPWADADVTLPGEREADALFCLAILDMRNEDLDACARALRRFARVRRHTAARGLTGSSRGLYWSAVRGEVQALARLGLPDVSVPLLAAVREEAGEPPDDITAAAAEALSGPAVQDHLVAQVNAGRYAEARLLADFLGEAAAHGIDRTYCLAVLDAQPDGNFMRAVSRFAAVRAALVQAKGETDAVPELYWAALRGEIAALITAGEDAAAEAVRRQALLDAGTEGGAVPEDLREPLYDEDDIAA